MTAHLMSERGKHCEKRIDQTTFLLFIRGHALLLALIACQPHMDNPTQSFTPMYRTLSHTLGAYS